MNLEEVLHKLYFQGYKFQEISELLPMALKQTKNVNQFFETLFTTVKNYADSVKKVIF